MDVLGVFEVLGARHESLGGQTGPPGFDRSFIGLTGTTDDINAAQRSLSLPPAVRQGEGPDYLMGHAAYVIAFTPDDSARVLYPSGTRQADWAHDLPILLETRWGTELPD